MERYVTESTDDANCMSCHKLLTREMLMNMTSKAFVNGAYKTHRRNQLWEREQCMLPATVPRVKQELQRRENTALLRKMLDERTRLKRSIDELDRSCRQIQQQLIPPLEAEKRTFVFKCGNANCKGFLNTNWKCEICKLSTCSDCGALKNEEGQPHACVDEERQSFQLIKRDSKRCPGCGTFIIKTTGCDQMWCTHCHTTFSWTTLRKVNGNVHNPHFYEYQRSRGAGGTLARDPGDIPCGGMPNINELRDAIKRHNTRCKQSSSQILPSIIMSHRGKGASESPAPLTSETIDDLYYLHRLVLHIIHSEQPRYHMGINDNDNADLRVSFMLQEIDEDTFKKRLYEREKTTEKRREIGLILEMMQNTLSEMFRDAVVSSLPSSSAEFKELLVFCNRSLHALSKRYNCVVPVVNLVMSFRMQHMNAGQIDANARAFVSPGSATTSKASDMGQHSA